MNSDIRIHSIQSEFMNLTACSNLLLAVTVVTRRGPPSLAAARPASIDAAQARRGQSHSDCAAARLCSPQPAALPQ